MVGGGVGCAVKEIDCRALGAWLGAPEDHLDGIRRIAVDEFALHLGRAYATVVLDLERKRVVWIARGRDAGVLRGFFTALRRMRCAKLEAAAVDMWQAYGNEIRAHCPQVRLVYDFCHIVVIYGREVVDRVRVDETNRLAKAACPDPIRDARRVIKGARLLLLRNRSSLTTSAERVRLRELPNANRALYTDYVLKEDLKRPWDYRSPEAALRLWKAWRRRALSNRIPPP